jgi:plastocyanin
MITNVTFSMRKTLISAAAAAATVAVLAVPALAGTVTVAVKDDVFKAKTVTINKGSSVKWVWKGSNPHNVTFKSFASKTIVNGSYKHKFRKRGTFKYRCTIHSWMNGKVVVR